MAKEVMKKQSAEMMNYDEDMFKGMDSGFEGTDSDTFKTPFMKILQALSPELNKNEPEYIPGAQAGMFCNSATKEVHEALEVVILKVEHSLICWKPGRSGFAGRFNKAEEQKVIADQQGLMKWDAEGNEVVDAIEFFCMNANDPSDIFILSLSKASIKHGKSFATRIRSLKVDGKLLGVSWAGVWHIDIVPEKNDKGSWYTIGGSPKFIRLITKDERDNFIFPAKEMLKTAETDYKVIEGHEAIEEDNEY